MERIIFDLDNTLISNVDFNIYVARALDDVSFSYTKEDLITIQRAIQDYEKNFERYDKKSMLESFKSYLKKELHDDFMDYLLFELEFAISNELEEGIVDTLEYLSDRYQMCVLTNWFKDTQEARLVNAGISDYFSGVYSGEVCKKPLRESYLLACGGIHPKECLMVGDSYVYDYQGAKNAGLNAILLDKKNVYPNIGENERIKSVKELKRVL